MNIFKYRNLSIYVSTIIIVALFSVQSILAEDKDFLYQKGVKLISEKQYEAARLVLRQYIQSDTLNANVFFDLGYCDECRGKYNDAMISYLNCLNLSKLYCLDSSVLRLNMANCLVHLKQFKEADFNYKRALEIDPKYNLARFNQARLYLFLNNYKAALDSFSQCQFDGYTNEWLGYFQAFCLYKLNRRDLALDKLKSLNNTGNNDVALYCQRLLNQVNVSF